MKKLIIFPQDKGGIGKSFVATLLYDYFQDQTLKLKCFDLDYANSTFQRYVPKAEFIDTDVDPHKLAVLDTMVYALETVDVVLVDNRATGGTKVLRYIEDSRLIELQKEIQFELLFVLVVLDDKDAISQAADALDAYQGKVKWLVTRNLRDTSNITMYDQSKTWERLLTEKAIEIEVPCFYEHTRNKLQLTNLTVGNGQRSPKLHLLDRSRCTDFHAVMTEQFNKAKELLLP